jgi:hypothetical protein
VPRHECIFRPYAWSTSEHRARRYDSSISLAIRVTHANPISATSDCAFLSCYYVTILISTYATKCSEGHFQRKSLDRPNHRFDRCIPRSGETWPPYSLRRDQIGKTTIWYIDAVRVYVDHFVSCRQDAAFVAKFALYEVEMAMNHGKNGLGHTPLHLKATRFALDMLDRKVAVARI